MDRGTGVDRAIPGYIGLYRAEPYQSRTVQYCTGSVLDRDRPSNL
ncbi:hypothetical protein [Paenibacillus ferrarius]